MATSVTWSGTSLGSINEGNTVGIFDNSSSLDQAWSVISSQYPTANRNRTQFSFLLIRDSSSAANSSDFGSNLDLFIDLEGDVLGSVGTRNDTADEPDEAFSFQPTLFRLRLRDATGSILTDLNPNEVAALFAPSGGITFNIGKITGTIIDNDLPPNTAPTDLTLSSTSVNENVLAGTTIGNFSTTDAEGGNFTYTLISGTGDTDNSAFTLNGDQLTINSSPDFETQSSYSIRVQTTDAGGLFYEEAFTINVTDVDENTAPTDLALSSTNVNENVLAGTTIGNFSTTDAEGGNFTYTLISGTGDTDNSAFTLNGDQLTINSSPDFETQSSYSIRVQTTDADGLSFEKVLAIDVNNINEAPTDLTLSSTSVNENVLAGTTIGSFSTTDAEGGNFTYTLISGTGSTDNNAFTLNGDQLTINSSPDFEAKSSYSIRVQTTDTDGLSFEKVLAIGVNNLNEAPTVTGETVSTSQNTGNPVTSLTVELGDNLSDPDLNGLANSLLNVTGTTNGTIASIDQDARLVTFTPTAGFSGTASFNYTLTDAGGLTSNTATVTIEVGSIISTGNRNQDIEGNNGDDFISAGNGSDRIQGLGGNDRLFGNNGKDTLIGGEGNDSLYGGNGSDVLLGSNGNDLLDGGNGPDIVTGGSGSDRFVLIPTADGDTFTDFTDTVDKIALSGGLTFGQLTISDSGSDTVIELNDTTLATLTEISASSITSADFVTL